MTFGMPNGKFKVYRAVYEKPSAGSPRLLGYKLVLEDVPGRLSPQDPDELRRSGRQTGATEYMFYCSPSYDIREKDVVQGNGLNAVVDAKKKTSQGRRQEILCEVTEKFTFTVL